jgi:hypothetical protein
MNELPKTLESINHPNISIKIFPPNMRLNDLKRATIIYPLTPVHLVLFNMSISNNKSIFKESSNYLFISEHLFVTSSMGLDYYDRSDGSLDAHPTSCTLLYEKIGINSFELTYDKEKKIHHLVLNMKDGNVFRSVGFKTDIEIPNFFIPTLNQALKVNKWD